MFVYAGALLLSVKLIDDTGLWYIEDFARATDVSAGLLAEMETFVFVEVL